jgi:hypothetical protein
VRFASNLTAKSVVNTATAGAPAAPSVATASSTNTLSTRVRAQPSPIPVDDRRALWLLACLVLLLGGRRARARQS